MFYGQCWKCGERWELGTAPSCTCPDEAEPYKFTDNSTEVLSLSKDGIWANPDIPADEAAKLVLEAIDHNIKVLVDKAVADERERIYFQTSSDFVKAAIAEEREACAMVCDAFQARDVGMQPAECAGAIRARSNT